MKKYCGIYGLVILLIASFAWGQTVTRPYPVVPQPTTPGTAQLGNIHVTGTIIADTGLSGPLSGSATSLKSSASTGLMTVTGMGAGTTRAKTVRDANDTVLELGGSYTPGGTWNWTSASVTWPTFNQSTSGTAAISSTSTITSDNSTNATMYPLWATALTGNLALKGSSAYTFNPSTGMLGITSATLTNGHQYYVGTAAPSAPTAAGSATAGSCTVGNHYVKITAITANGETNLSAASAVVASDGSHKIDVSGIPAISGVITGYKIYMTKAGGTTYYYVDVTTSTTYAIDIADASLTILAPTSNTTTGGIFSGGTKRAHLDPVTGTLGLGEINLVDDTILFHAIKSSGLTQIRAENTSTSDGSVGGQLTAKADVANFAVSSWSSGRSSSRFGLVLGGYTELAQFAGNGILIGTYNSAPLIFGTNNTENMRIASGGAITAPSVYTQAVTSARAVLVDSTGLLGNVTSSKRYKENIRDMENVSWLYKLRPVNFNRIGRPDDEKEYGCIAEEVATINEAMITRDKDDNPETVEYQRLIAPLLKAVQDQDKRILTLEYGIIVLALAFVMLAVFVIKRTRK